MSLAGAGEVLVSATTRDLVAGSGLEFEDRGEHELKGIEGARRVFVPDRLAESASERPGPNVGKRPLFRARAPGRTVEGMAIRASDEAVQTYLVEHYRPGLTVDGLWQWAGKGAGRPQPRWSVRARRCATSAPTIVPADETLLCVLEAAPEELVREIYARAGIPFERLSAVVPEEGRAEEAAGTRPPDTGGAEHRASRRN